MSDNYFNGIEHRYSLSLTNYITLARSMYRCDTHFENRFEFNTKRIRDTGQVDFFQLVNSRVITMHVRFLVIFLEIRKIR